MVYQGPIEAPISQGQELAELVIHPEGLPDDLSTAVLGSAGDQVPDVAALLNRLAWAAQPQDDALVAVADGWRVTLEPAERGAEGPEALAAATTAWPSDKPPSLAGTCW